MPADREHAPAAPAAGGPPLPGGLPDPSRTALLAISLDGSLVANDGATAIGDTVARHVAYASHLRALHVIVKTGPQRPDGSPYPEVVRLAPNAWAWPTRSRHRLLFVPDAIRLGLAIARRHEIDVVSAQDPFATGVAGLAIARLAHLPLNVQVHFDFAGNPWWARERREHRFFLPAARAIVRAATTVRTGTTRERDLYAAWRGGAPGPRTGEPGDVVVAPVAVDLDRFAGAVPDPDMRTWVATSGGDAMVLSMARLVDSKDHVTLLRAFARVVRASPGARLAIAGAGPLATALATLSRDLGLDGAVRFLGPVDGSRGPAMMAAADVYALVSRYEGTSLVTLEAAACRVPVVSTDVAGVDDTIVDGVTGMVVPVGDVEAVARAILSLLADPGRRAAMGDAARAHVAARFGRDDAVASLVSLWAATAAPSSGDVPVTSTTRRGRGAGRDARGPGPGAAEGLAGMPADRGRTPWAYVANVRFPSEKAQSMQVAQMVDAFGASGVAMELLHPARANLGGLGESDPRATYALRAPLDRRALGTLDPVRLVTIDVPALNRPPLPALAFGLQAASFAITAAAHLARSPARVIYGRDWPVLGVATLVARGRPVVWEAHDLPERDRSRSALGRVLPRLAAIVAISHGLRDDLVAMGVARDRILVAPDAVAWERFESMPSRAAARALLGVDAGTELVVYTGHLYPWKGTHVLARAAPALRARRPNARVAIVGGTPADVTAFRAFVHDEGIDGVDVVGHVAPASVPTWLAAADVTVLPNSGRSAIGARYTSPLKLYEYLAAGRAVVASDVPAVREVVRDGKTAVLVAPDDPAALADGLWRVLADRDLSTRLGEAGRAWVRGRTWDARARVIREFVEGFTG